MGKRKYTETEYEEALAIYEGWDPYAPDGIKLDEMLEAAGLMSRQSLYSWMRARGIPLKRTTDTLKASVQESDTTSALVAMMTDLSLRVRKLEDYIRAQGLPLP